MSRLWLFSLVLSLVLLPFMVSSESFWIDEAWAGNFARQPDFAAWQHSFVTDTSAEAQQPLYPLVTWLWGKVFGTTERALRAENLIWGAVVLTSLALVGHRLRLPWLPLLAALQPFLWFYMNEARPYVLQMALGSCLLVGFVDFILAEGRGSRWFIILSATSLVFCHTTMLAPATLLGVLGVGAWVAWRRHWSPNRQALLWFGGAAVLSIPIGLYYLGSLLRGAHSSQIWPITVKNFGFLAYEFLGLTGLGPSLLQLRELGRGGHLFGAGAMLFLAPALCLGLLLTLALVGWKRRALPAETAEGPDATAVQPSQLLLVVCLIAAFFIVIGTATHKAFWARHLSAAFPFYLTALGLLWCAAKQRLPRPLYLSLTTLLIALLAASSINLHWGPNQRKENYRAAVAYTKAALAQHDTVWWIAAKETADYYQLPMSDAQEEPDRAFIFRDRKTKGQDESERAMPALIVVSRPEAFDEDGIASQFLAQHSYQVTDQLTGFLFYRRPSTVAPASSSPLR